MLSIALRFWKEAVIVALIFFLMAACADRDRALIEKGKAEQRMKIADSALKVFKQEMVELDRKVVHDTISVTEVLHVIDSFPVFKHDTVWAISDSLHLHPLVPLPARQVEMYEKLGPACVSLKGDCIEFRANAQKQFASYEEKLKAKTIVISNSCVLPTGIGVGVGALAGFLAGRAGGTTR